MEWDRGMLVGVFAGLVCMFDLAGLWLRGAHFAARQTQLRLVGATAMGALSVALLSGWIKLP